MKKKEITPKQALELIKFWAEEWDAQRGIKNDDKKNKIDYLAELYVMACCGLKEFREYFPDQCSKLKEIYQELKRRKEI